jgi:hypothetical protein
MSDTQSSDHLTVEWIDGEREPQCPPDPEFPNGVHLDFTKGRKAPFCTTDLPYPAQRCGFYAVTCSLCGISVACTTAGRPDDPRSIRIPCKVVMA